MQVTLKTGRGPLVVKAHKTPVAGLVVHPTLDYDGNPRRADWTLTHANSGLVVFSGFRNRKHATISSEGFSFLDWEGIEDLGSLDQETYEKCSNHCRALRMLVG